MPEKPTSKSQERRVAAQAEGSKRLSEERLAEISRWRGQVTCPPEVEDLLGHIAAQDAEAVIDASSGDKDQKT